MKPKKTHTYTLIATLFFLSVCGGFFCKKSSETQVTTNDSLSFIVLGDWGKYGRQNQKEVAAQMIKYGKIHDTRFVITTGDNFYPVGVRSITDTHWQLSYEDVYIKDSLPVNWYPVLGNHDYLSNPQAQIEYASVSDRWVMPGRHYAIKQKVNGADSLLLVFTDTSPFISYYHRPEYTMADLKTQDTAAQTRWLQATLKASADRWKIVVGHHPFYSVGAHGDNPDLIKRHKPILLQNKTDFYIAGHDHDLQYLKQPNEELHYLVSGGGSENRSVQPNAETLFAQATPGFLIITLYSKKAHFYFYDKDGQLLYQQQIDK